MTASLSEHDRTRLRETHYNATVAAVRHVHEALMILRVVPDQGPLIFQPGQYTLLGLGAWEPRGSRSSRKPIRDCSSQTRAASLFDLLSHA